MIWKVRKDRYSDQYLQWEIDVSSEYETVSHFIYNENSVIYTSHLLS